MIVIETYIAHMNRFPSYQNITINAYIFKSPIKWNKLKILGRKHKLWKWQNIEKWPQWSYFPVFFWSWCKRFSSISQYNSTCKNSRKNLETDACQQTVCQNDHLHRSMWVWIYVQRQGFLTHKKCNNKPTLRFLFNRQYV